MGLVCLFGELAIAGLVALNTGSGSDHWKACHKRIASQISLYSPMIEIRKKWQTVLDLEFFAFDVAIIVFILGKYHS